MPLGVKDSSLRFEQIIRKFWGLLEGKNTYVADLHI